MEEDYESVITDSINELNAQKDFSETEIDRRKPKKSTPQTNIFRRPEILILGVISLCSTSFYLYLGALERGQSLVEENNLPARVEQKIQASLDQHAEIASLMALELLQSEERLLGGNSKVLLSKERRLFQQQLRQIGAPREIIETFSQELPGQGFRSIK